MRMFTLKEIEVRILMCFSEIQWKSIAVVLKFQHLTKN